MCKLVKQPPFSLKLLLITYHHYVQTQGENQKSIARKTSVLSATKNTFLRKRGAVMKQVKFKIVDDLRRDPRIIKGRIIKEYPHYYLIDQSAVGRFCLLMLYWWSVLIFYGYKYIQFLIPVEDTKLILPSKPFFIFLYLFIWCEYTNLLCLIQPSI